MGHNVSAYPLSKPGDVSEWISIGTAYERAGGESKPLADKMRGVEVVVKVLSRRDVIGLRDASSKAAKTGDDGSAERELSGLDADEAWIAAGLARMRGVGRDVDSVDRALLDSLAASHLTWLVALVVRTYNELDSDARQGFFAPVQEA